MTKTHTVKRGDTLWKISKLHYGGDASLWEQISLQNNLKNPNQLFIGQPLIIPNSCQPPQPPKTRGKPIKRDPMKPAISTLPYPKQEFKMKKETEIQRLNYKLDLQIEGKFELESTKSINGFKSVELTEKAVEEKLNEIRKEYKNVAQKLKTWTIKLNHLTPHNKDMVVEASGDASISLTVDDNIKLNVAPKTASADLEYKSCDYTVKLKFKAPNQFTFVLESEEISGKHRDVKFKGNLNFTGTLTVLGGGKVRFEEEYVENPKPVFLKQVEHTIVLIVVGVVFVKTAPFWLALGAAGLAFAF